MTKRAFLAILLLLFWAVCALSTAGALLWLFVWTLFIMLLITLCATLWTLQTFSLTLSLPHDHAPRGGNATLHMDMLHRCPLPFAKLRLSLASIPGTGLLEVHITPYTINRLTQTLTCPHVGVFSLSDTGVRVLDVMGLWDFPVKRLQPPCDLTVTPVPYPMPALPFAPGESDDARSGRAFEDATMPTDVRAFQQGDELKKVHWKLSMRRKELLVRVYEQPLQPDALLLMDASPPDAGIEFAPDVQDVLTEAVASLARTALSSGSPIRLPIRGDREIATTKLDEMPAVLEALARCPFDSTESFDRVLRMEARRLRRSGSTAIITSRLTPEIAETILAIRRMGPRVRVLLHAPETDATVLLTRRLIRNDVEVHPLG